MRLSRKVVSGIVESSNCFGDSPIIAAAIKHGLAREAENRFAAADEMRRDLINSEVE